MKKTGFSLIEVLVSTFVLAIGILGMAQMQMVAVKSTLEVQQRALATSLLIDIDERMQLNQMWLATTGNNYTTESISAASSTVPSCITDATECSGAEIRQNDFVELREKLLHAHVNNTPQGLVNADACIDGPDVSGKVIMVLSWQSKQSSIDAAASESAGSIYRKCGSTSTRRQQISTETFVSKSS